MVLTENVLNFGYIDNARNFAKPLVDGALAIFKGSLMNYEAANIGYVKNGADIASEEFAGLALKEFNVAAADNTSDGTFESELVVKGSGKVILFQSDRIEGTITLANTGDLVYVKDDQKIGLVGDVTNNVEVGTIVHVGADGVYVVI